MFRNDTFWLSRYNHFYISYYFFITFYLMPLIVYSSPRFNQSWFNIGSIYFLHMFANKQRRTWVLSCCFALSLTPFSVFSTFSSFLWIWSKISVGRVSAFRQSPVWTQLLAASSGLMVDDVVVDSVVLKYIKIFANNCFEDIIHRQKTFSMLTFVLNIDR